MSERRDAPKVLASGVEEVAVAAVLARVDLARKLRDFDARRVGQHHLSQHVPPRLSKVELAPAEVVGGVVWRKVPSFPERVVIFPRDGAERAASFESDAGFLLFGDDGVEVLPSPARWAARKIGRRELSEWSVRWNRIDTHSSTRAH